MTCHPLTKIKILPSADSASVQAVIVKSPEMKWRHLLQHLELHYIMTGPEADH
jgi:hypothetical protein